MTKNKAPALETLFYGLEQIGASQDDARILFVNAQAHGALGSHVHCAQWFYPYAKALSAQGFEVVERIEDAVGDYQAIYLLVPKNMTEARYLVARSFELLKDEGALYCACENKAGGTRLQKMLQQFGVEIVQQISKHKCRFVQVVNTDVDDAVVRNAIDAGAVKSVDQIHFTSQAGIYGWDKIDKGSALLLQHVPDDLKGKIADFGCGYGYLLQHLLQRNNAIKAAYAIDADARALHVARENLKGDSRVEYLWSDLTTPKDIPTRLDAIIMNPPFHEGKRTSSDIGIAFIKTAAACLKRDGVLYMVANNQLPYEHVLEETFHSHKLLGQEGGFKVFKAVV